MFHTKKIILLVVMISVVGLTACSKNDDNQSSSVAKENSKKTVLEMDMDADYSNTDPFENGLLFCVSEDMDSLDAEIFFQMDGESGIVEIKDRNADEILWSQKCDENVSDNTFTITLKNLQKVKEYAVQFTGTKINDAVVKVSFDSDLVQEKERPSK
ncbi:DUF4624 family lipoprotein [Extibacter sp. GGCC_0201]|uniref:DUF4624 family lipoprotein n=1 Tax=Extibacter sp. GGCC_0201 TaxID=2731209 RepID=UPI001AA1498A|nr:DUF4624 family lipoprotein [Extibacter sp. GGCC_0201]MBO1722708.1 DUF4624 family lipoprotein [Extibacter sp. GGCC_0201]